jgi:hypothetical protein
MEGWGWLNPWCVLVQGPAPLPFRDFFLAQQNFWHEQYVISSPLILSAEKWLQYPTLRGLAKVRVEQVPGCRQYSGDLFSDCIGPRPPVARDVNLRSRRCVEKMSRNAVGVGYSNLYADFPADRWSWFIRKKLKFNTKSPPVGAHSFRSGTGSSGSL